MDGQQLTASPAADFGPLVVVAPPWGLRNVLTARMFSLVLRNPRDPSRGLTLLTNTSREALAEVASGMVEGLRDHDPAMLALLADAATYDALSGDPALLSAVAEAAAVSGALGVSQLLGGSSSGGGGSSSSSGYPAPSAAAGVTTPGADASAAAGPEAAGECPICYEDIRPGDAAMRCCGEAGVHHYFHAHCLKGWMRACQQSRSGATCPVCRGRLQFNGQRLQQYLNSTGAASLSEEERSFLEQVSDGLQGRNEWGGMNTVEKVAYAGGVFAAAGWGFMLGYTHRSHQASNMLIVHSVPQEHQLAQGIGWIAGLLVRVIREALKDRERDDDRRRRRN